MTFTYPAVFTKKDDNTYEGFFPDLEGCTFSGATLDDAINEAIAAEKDWINVEFEDETLGLPYITDEADLELAENQFVRPIQVIIHYNETYSD